MNHTFVKDVMKTNIVSAESSSSIKEAAQMMEENKVGCIIVLEDAMPIGILTERDFVNRVAAKEKSVSEPISDIMSSPLTTIDPEETVWEAAELMKSKKIHKLPVKQGNSIVGILTTSDLVEICSAGSDSSMRNMVDQILLRMKDSS